jgi:ribose transport system ATP-binding protein
VIFDEPTSSLTEREAERLFDVIARLKADGVGLVYISHRLKEVEKLADRAVVLRDGRNAGDLARGEINHQNLVRLMVGRELKKLFHRTHGADAAATPIVEASDFRWSTAQREGVAFAMRPGEVVGLAGLMGAGRTELAETLFGIRPRLSGRLKLEGREVRIDSPHAAVDAGVLLVPEDRRLQGLVIDFPVRENIGLPSLARMQRVGIVDRPSERRLAENMRERLTIRTPDVDKAVGLLSGGNQQKVVIAKWLARNPKLLILDEPTRGVDVGAKAEIYAIVDELVRAGVAVLMISSDLEEILGVSDRVLVMHEGRLTGELVRAELTEQAVMNLAVGGAGGK